MKKIKFNDRPTHIAEAEVPNKKKRINWDRLVYMAILGTIMTSLVVYLVRNYYYITAPGQVVKESYLVMLPYDVRVNELLAQEDDSVVAGQPLFRFERDFRLSNDELLNSAQSVDEWIVKERFQAQRHIRTRQAELNKNHQLITHHQKQLEQLKLRVVLEVSNRNEVASERLDIVKLKADSEVLREEIAYWKDYQRRLPEFKARHESQMLRQLGGRNNAVEFLSPISGHVSEINFQQHELVYKGESLLNIEQEDAYIKAYIPQKEFGNMTEGDMVTVIFPDKTKSKGIIDKVYSQLERLPPEYQSETGPKIRSLLAIVRPISDEAMERWKLNNKLNVEIRKARILN